jgi:hypothetical protein
VRITVVGPADLAELQPLMRAYADFYQVAPGDQALLELSQALLADPQREGLQMLARDDTGQHLHGCGVQRPDRPRVPRPGGLPAGPVRDRATAGAVRPWRAHLRRAGPQHDREPGVAWADATHPRPLPLSGPEASQFFDPPETDTQFQAALGTVGLQSSPGQRLFAGASLVAAIYSILGGAGLAVLAARVADLGDGAALAVGAAVALVLFVLHLLYQQRRSAHIGLSRSLARPPPDHRQGVVRAAMG